MNGFIFLQCKTHEMYLQGIELFPVSNHCRSLHISCSYQTNPLKFPFHLNNILPIDLLNFVHTMVLWFLQRWPTLWGQFVPNSSRSGRRELTQRWICYLCGTVHHYKIALLQHMSFILDLLKAMSAKVGQSHTVFVICLIHMKQQQHSVLSSFSELTSNRNILSFTHRFLIWLFCMFLWGAVPLDDLIDTIVVLTQFQNIIHFFCTSVKIG